MGFRKAILIPFTLVFLSLFFASSVLATTNAISADACKTCAYSNDSCNVNGNTTSQSAGTNTLVLVVLIGLATFYLWKQYKRKLYLAFGAVAMLAIGASYVYTFTGSAKPAQSTTECKLVSNNVKPTLDNEFKPATDEFTSVDSLSEFSSQDSSSNVSEFASVASEFTATDNAKPIAVQANTLDTNLLYQLIVLFMLIILIGITMKYRVVRKLRGFILLGSVVYLGFVKGGCPCMIMSFQNTVLFTLGNVVSWVSMLWFLGLLLLTYFFGKVWCGWLCHLGGLQDFLFKVTGWYFLSSQKSQRVLNYIQIGLLATLLVQLLITRSNIYVHYDPFKVAFNLISANTTGYILLVLLLLSSVLIYRPFCRMACPVGLILGWVTLIPGARKLKVAKDTCNGCHSCYRQCKQYALHGSTTPIKINTQECILCGECISQCKKSSLSVSSKKIKI